MVIENKIGDKFETILFLPVGEGRKGEGGLRIQGYSNRRLPDKPLLTVITVVFNGEKHLEETIKSVIGQNYDNMEYIIIDGGSTDRTLEIIRKYEQMIDYWVSEKDKGVYDAINKGILLACGQLIGLIHSGSQYTIETASTVEELNSCSVLPSIIAGSAKWLTPSGGQKVRSTLKHLSPKNPSILHETLFIPKRILVDQGGYDTTYDISADYKMLAHALKKQSVEVIYTDKIFVVYIEGWGISGTPGNQIKKAVEHFRVQSAYVNLPFAIFRLFNRILRLFLIRILRRLKYSPKLVS